MPFPLPHNEIERLALLRRMQALDTGSTAALDRLVEAARQVFEVPVVLVSLIDDERLWYKVSLGTDVAQVPRESAFCNYTILHDEVFVVPDAGRDARFAGNPHVAGDAGMRFYAGAPLILKPGVRIGSLCILDTVPRDFDERHLRILGGLAQMVTDELWLEQVQRHGFARLDDAQAPLRRARGLDVDLAQPVTGFQVRGARGLINWSIRELADASGVSTTTIKRVEAAPADRPVREPIGGLLSRALQVAGVEFVFDPGQPPGVRPARRRTDAVSPGEVGGNASRATRRA